MRAQPGLELRDATGSLRVELRDEGVGDAVEAPGPGSILDPRDRSGSEDPAHQVTITGRGALLDGSVHGRCAGRGRAQDQRGDRLVVERTEPRVAA